MRLRLATLWGAFAVFLSASVSVSVSVSVAVPPPGARARGTWFRDPPGAFGLDSGELSTRKRLQQGRVGERAGPIRTPRAVGGKLGRRKRKRRSSREGVTLVRQGQAGAGKAGAGEAARILYYDCACAPDITRSERGLTSGHSHNGLDAIRR